MEHFPKQLNAFQKNETLPLTLEYFPESAWTNETHSRTIKLIREQWNDFPNDETRSLQYTLYIIERLKKITHSGVVVSHAILRFVFM
jgi:hypothetical protein